MPQNTETRLRPEERERVRQLVERMKPVRAAEMLDTSRESVVRAALGLDVKRATLVVIRQALGRLEDSEAGGGGAAPMAAAGR